MFSLTLRKINLTPPKYKMWRRLQSMNRPINNIAVFLSNLSYIQRVNKEHKDT